MNIIVSKEIESVCPTFVGACVEAQVANTNYNQELWDEINKLGNKYKQELTTESLKSLSGIAATRKVYRDIVLPQRHSSAVCCREKASIR